MSDSRQTRLPLLIALGLLLVTLTAFWPVLSNDFINYDDYPYVVGNSHVHSGLTWQNCSWAFNIGYACNWHPLTWLSHMADCQWFALAPRGHHLTNLALHSINVVLLFGVLWRMTGATWPSALTATLFGWHPLHVESVAWVAERKDLLSTLWFLLTLAAYARYVSLRARAEGDAPGILPGHAPITISRISLLRRPATFFLLALLSFALGLMSKPMVVTLPFVLLLLDYWPLHRMGSVVPGTFNRVLGRLVFEKVPFFALSAVSCAITIVAQRRGGAVVPLQVIPFDTRCWNALASWLRYAVKLLWPTDLAVIYPYVLQWSPGVLFCAIAFLSGMGYLALRCRRLAPYLPVGWFWYLGTLVPVIGLVQVGEQAMADRYTYIPSIGLFIVVSWAAQQAVNQHRQWRPAVVLAAALVLAACGWATRTQVRHWRNGIALFGHAIEVTKSNAVAHATLGLALMDAGEHTKAIAHFEEALRISPAYSLAHNDLGVTLARLGRFDEAIAHYQNALSINPEDAEAHFNIANALNPGYVDTYADSRAATNRVGDPTQARQHYQAAIRLRPSYINALINWGNLELTVGDNEASVQQYREAIRLDPHAGLAYFNMGNALVKLGRTKEAVAAYWEAVALEPQDPQARFRLANLLASQGEFEKAIPHYRQVIRLEPGDYVARCNLGSALGKLGKREEAERSFREALHIQPEYPDAHINLAKLLAEKGNLDAALEQCSAALRLQTNNPELHRQAALWLSQQGKLPEALNQFSQAARLRPTNPGAHYDLGVALVKSGDSEAAVASFHEALRLKQNYVLAMNNLAWILATHRKAQIRDGAEAVRLATRACVLTAYKEPHVTGTLDAAYAENGQFDKAAEMAEKTRELALAAGDKALAEEATTRVRLYRVGKPYRTTEGASEK